MAKLINWSTLAVSKPSEGRVGWYVRLSPSGLTVYEDADLARSLTEALQDRVRGSAVLPDVLIESIHFQQIQDRNPFPYESSQWRWNWTVGGSLPAEEDQDWERIRSELEAAVSEVVAAQCDPERAGEEAAKRIATRFMGRSADSEAGGGAEVK